MKAAFQGDGSGCVQEDGCSSGMRWRRTLRGGGHSSGEDAREKYKTWCVLDLRGGKREGKLRDEKSGRIVLLAKMGEARWLLSYRCTEFGLRIHK